MSFHEIRFPVSISFGAIGGPRESTTVIELDSGFEQRNINWSTARREYSFDHVPAASADYAAALAFFIARRGRAYGFRLKDWSDYQLSKQTIGTGDGATTTFQIVKTYTDAGGSFVRSVKKPVAASGTLYLDDVEQPSGWSMDSTTGIITFSVAPTAAVVVDFACEFDVPVRFDSDLMQASRVGPDIDHWTAIKMIEVRV